MGRERLSSSTTFILVLILGALHRFSDAKELRREVSCPDELSFLDCSNHSFIAIHEGYYDATASEGNLSCSPRVPATTQRVLLREDESAPNDSTCYEDIRVFLNRRCSGLRSCNFSYTDEPERSCTGQSGLFFIRYDCVRESSVNKYCNVNVPSKEGYISSPGFPLYYPGLRSCSWTLHARPGQEIQLRVLHLHMRPATEIIPTVSDPDSAAYALGLLSGEPVLRRCDDDALSVAEGPLRRLVVCGETAGVEVEVEAANGPVEVNFKSVDFLPASGFLMYFKVRGCPSVRPPEDGRVVESNGSAAVVACSEDRVFNDTLENARVLHCVRNHHWNDSMAPCVLLEDVTTATTTLNSSLSAEMENVTFGNVEVTSFVMQARASYIEDILIPSILIGVLLLGNTIILIIIIIIRRKRKSAEDEEDLNQPKSSVPLTAKVSDV